MFQEGSRTYIKLEGETHVYAAMDTCNTAELYAHQMSLKAASFRTSWLNILTFLSLYWFIFDQLILGNLVVKEQKQVYGRVYGSSFDENKFVKNN